MFISKKKHLRTQADCALYDMIEFKILKVVNIDHFIY